MKNLLAGISIACCFPALVFAQVGGNPTVVELVAKYKAHPQIDSRFLEPESEHKPEAILNALMARGDAALELLRELRNSPASRPQSDEAWSLSNDLALLTTIRRIEGMIPPLRIEVNERLILIVASPQVGAAG